MTDADYESDVIIKKVYKFPWATYVNCPKAEHVAMSCLNIPKYLWFCVISPEFISGPWELTEL